MQVRTVVIWLAVVAVVIAGTLAMRGEGHRMLAKWMPSMHGGTR
jgi:hypothetical protein